MAVTRKGKVRKVKDEIKKKAERKRKAISEVIRTKKKEIVDKWIV